MTSIKRGATFKATLEFTEQEWAAIYPWDAIEAEVGQGSKRYPLNIQVNAAARTVTLVRVNTSLWVVGPAAFDVWITRGSQKLPFPASSNIRLNVIEGITE